MGANRTSRLAKNTFILLLKSAARVRPNNVLVLEIRFIVIFLFVSIFFLKIKNGVIFISLLFCVRGQH